jgi:hypothetical protein
MPKNLCIFLDDMKRSAPANLACLEALSNVIFERKWWCFTSVELADENAWL